MTLTALLAALGDAPECPICNFAVQIWHEWRESK